MTKLAALFFVLALSATVAFTAEEKQRFVKRFQFPVSLETVIVAEGDFEPRSIGSYTVRVYGGRSGKFPTDDFITGIVRPRNGIIEAVRFNDIDGDNRPEIIVVMRAAGSGGYLSADALRYRNKFLSWMGSVSDLEKTADPIEALRAKLKSRPADQVLPDSRKAGPP